MARNKSGTSDSSVTPEVFSSMEVDGVEISTGGNRIRYFDRVDTSEASVPEESLITVTVHSTIHDRLAGTVVTEPVWRREPNLAIINIRAADGEIRRICSDFFISRKSALVIKDICPMATLHPGDAFVIQGQLFEAIGRQVPDPSAQFVLMEIMNSYLMRMGVVANTGDYTTRAYYPFKPVTTKALADDIAMHEVVRVLSSVQELQVAKRKYSKESFAAEAAEALYPVGRAMLEVNELGGVIDDIVRGIRARLDPQLTGVNGNVQIDWQNHETVDELSRNYVFMLAALNLPAGASVSLCNDPWKLNKWAPVVLAALKQSKRYAIVGRGEVLRTMGLRHVRNLRGQVMSYVMWRSASPQAVAQSVFGYEDATIDQTYTVVPTKERIADAVASAYGEVKKLGTDGAAEYLWSFLTDAVEAGYTNPRLGYYIDIGDYDQTSMHEVACMMATRVRVYIDSSTGVGMPFAAANDAKGNPNPMAMVNSKSGWWFNVETSERDMGVWGSGRYDSTNYFTNQIGEVFLAYEDFEPLGSLEARPQLLAPISFNSRIVGFNDNILISTRTKYSFDVEINKARLTGTIKVSDLGSLRASDDTALVMPAFNAEVFDAVSATFGVMYQEIKNIVKFSAATDADGDQANTNGPSADIVIALNRMIGRHLLRYAQHLSKPFRAEVQRAMIDRSLSKMSATESLGMRARLAQKSFGGYADVNALLLFFMMQGINARDIKEIAVKEDMMQTFLEYGTDRTIS